MRQRTTVAILAALSLGAGSCMNPEVEAKQWDEIQATIQSIQDIRTYLGELEMTLDSMRAVLAKQDTALRLIVDFTGTQVPSYRSDR